MTYYKEFYSDNGEWVKEEITKEKAIDEISKYYTNAESLAEVPCYYRTMYGGVEVIEK
jgi:hypothetical protein